MPNIGFSYSHSEVCLPQDLWTYDPEGCVPPNSCLSVRKTRGQRAAHCELEATSVNVTPVNLQRKMLVVEGLMHVAEIALHHILQRSAGPQSTTAVSTLARLHRTGEEIKILHKITVLNLSIIISFFYKLFSWSLRFFIKEISARGCLASILISSPSPKLQSMSLKHGCCSSIKTRLSEERSSWWTYRDGHIEDIYAHGHMGSLWVQTCPAQVLIKLSGLN